jgi:hypothetical protein
MLVPVQALCSGYQAARMLVILEKVESQISEAPSCHVSRETDLPRQNPTHGFRHTSKDILNTGSD